jgi:hypothetical protein
MQLTQRCSECNLVLVCNLIKEYIMYDDVELKQRFKIIDSSTLDDASILDENYLKLIKDTANTDERQQFIILHTNVQRRIQKLKETA